MEAPDFSRAVGGRGAPNSDKTKSRKFVFTLNNYTDGELKRIREYPETVKYVAYEKEVAPSTGTLHLQGFLYTWEPMRISQLHSGFLKRARFCVMYSDFDHNNVYCKKDTGELEEFGERPAQGKRTDIIGVKRRIDAGENLYEIMKDESFFSIIMQNERALQKYSSYIRGQRLRAGGRKVPQVLVRIGPSRSGKSSYIFDKHGYENVFSVPKLTGDWYDGYDGQKFVVFDDVEAGKVPPCEHFKRITDGIPMQVPIKGGFTWFLPEIIYFTSNHAVKDWWPGIDSKDWKAHINRIWEVVAVFPDDRPDVVTYTNLFGVEPAPVAAVEVMEEEDE
jgi:hypothetical protein